MGKLSASKIGLEAITVAAMILGGFKMITDSGKYREKYLKAFSDTPQQRYSLKNHIIYNSSLAYAKEQRDIGIGVAMLGVGIMYVPVRISNLGSSK